MATITHPGDTAPPGTARSRPSGRRPKAARRGSLARQQRRVGLLFVAPFVVVAAAFMLVPLGYAFRSSLFSDSMILGSHFTGLDNYKTAFTDPEFLHGLLRVLEFGVVQVPVMIAIALFAALVLDRFTSRFARAFRLFVFLPYAVPGVVGALMWGFLYSPAFGPFKVDFLGAHLVLGSIGNIVLWQWTGYNMIVLYAALQGVPRECYEAAVVEGASQWQIATRVKIPMISSALVMTVIFSIIGTMQLFVEPSVIRQAAPSSISTSYTPNMYAQTLAFADSQFNYSATISFALGAMVFLVSYLFMFVNRRRSGLQ